MMLLRRMTPYNDANVSHPLVAYRVRHIRGGSTPAQMMTTGRYAFWVVGLVMLIPLLLLMLLLNPTFSDPYHDMQIAARYAIAAVLFSIGLYPLVDFFTVYFAAMSIRTDTLDNTHYDLMRVSLIPPATYISTRIALARARAWRVFIFAWAARLIAALMLLSVVAGAILIGFYENEFRLPLRNNPDVWFDFTLIAAGMVIFAIQLLCEPIWRLEMLTAFGASMGARFHRGPLMWLFLGLGWLVIVILQGALAAGVVWLALSLGELVEILFSYSGLVDYGFRSDMQLLVGLIPYALMPFAVWNLQRWFRGWRERVAARYIFKKQGPDA